MQRDPVELWGAVMLQGRGQPAASPTPLMACSYSLGSGPPPAAGRRIQHRVGTLRLDKPCQVPVHILIAGGDARGRVQCGTPHPISSGMEAPAAGPGRDLHFQVNR